MKLIPSAALIAIGYVLGSKAGRERYEQIVEVAQTLSTRLEDYSDRSSQDGARDVDAWITGS